MKHHWVDNFSAMSRDARGCSFPSLGPELLLRQPPSEDDPSVYHSISIGIVLARLDISEAARLLFSVKVSVKI